MESTPLHLKKRRKQILTLNICSSNFDKSICSTIRRHVPVSDEMCDCYDSILRAVCCALCVLYDVLHTVDGEYYDMVITSNKYSSSRAHTFLMLLLLWIMAIYYDCIMIIYNNGIIGACIIFERHFFLLFCSASFIALHFWHAVIASCVNFMIVNCEWRMPNRNSRGNNRANQFSIQCHFVFWTTIFSKIDQKSIYSCTLHTAHGSHLNKERKKTAKAKQSTEWDWFNWKMKEKYKNMLTYVFGWINQVHWREKGEYSQSEIVNENKTLYGKAKRNIIIIVII